MQEPEPEHEHNWESNPGPIPYRYRCQCGVIGFARGNGMGQRRTPKVKALKCTVTVRKDASRTTCGKEAMTENIFATRLCAEHQR